MAEYPDHIRIAKALLSQQGEINALRVEASMLRRAVDLATDVVVNTSQKCRYHGQNWDFLGRERPGGLPRCDSCKQPYRATLAAEAIRMAHHA